MNTAKKPNGYLFDPDEDSDSGEKTPSDMSGDSFCLSVMSVTNLSIFIISMLKTARATQDYIYVSTKKCRDV